MKTFTNLAHRAFKKCASLGTTNRNRYYLFSIIMLLTLGAGTAWGEDVTFNYADYQGKGTQSTGSSYTMEKSGMLSIENDKFYGNTSYAHFYAKGTITVTPATGVTITKIVLTASGSSYNGYQDGGTITASTGTISGSGTTVTWTGSATNAFTLNNSKQIRWKTIVVTYTGSSTPAKTYDVTWMVNGEEWDTTEDVEENTQITTLPTEPTDECAGKVFQGWTDKEITDGQKPAVLFKDKSPEITGNTTFYAVFATVPAGGGTGGSITISSETENFPTAYGTANTFTEYTLEDYKFKIQQVYKIGEKLQWRASGNKSGTGTMYNTQKFPANIASIVIVFDASDSNKNHTVKVGATENPTSGTSISPSISDVTYTFDCSGGSYDYFVLTNGSGAGYITSITINYGSVATPIDYTTSCSGSTEPVVPLTDEQLKWSAATATALKGAAENAFPELTNSLEVDVAYTSSNASVATIAADGQITLLAPGTTTISAIFAGGEVSGTKYAAKTVTYTLTVKQLVSCADIYNLADDATFVLKDFVVTYVNGKYTYIKDATGYGLIYKDSYGLIAGDQVASGKFEGKRDSYNGLVEIIPTTAAIDLHATNGTAPEPELMATNPVAGDMNKYVKFENVSFASTAFSSKSINGTIEGQGSSIKFYDQFATDKTFDTSKKYDVIGVVSMFNSVQVNFISAEEVAEPTLNLTTTPIDFGKVAINSTNESTLQLSGSLLTKDITLSVEGDSYFTVSANSITPSEGNVNETITITYEPTVEGTHTATLKITSDELTEQTITLTGNAVEEYTVHFYVNGEEQTELAKTILSGNTLDALPEEPESCDPLTYPTFAGWASDEIDGTTDVKPTMLDLSTPITSDCNYYAVFEKATVGGSSEEQTETITIENFKSSGDGEKRTCETNSATWTWLKNNASSPINVTYAEIRLYQYHSMTISQKDGCDISKIVANVSELKYATPFAGELSGAEKTLDGNNITLTPTSEDIVIKQSAQSRVNSFVVTYTTSTTTYEYITSCEVVVPTCEITYDFAGGEGECTTDIVEKDTEYTLCATAPAKTGHTFLKWKDQNGDEYEAGATINSVTEDLTLTAQWQINSYKVTWTSLGEEVASANVEYNSQPTKPETDPTYKCYGEKEFVGWTTKEIDGVGTPENLYTDEFPVVTEAVTYYAVFAGKSTEASVVTNTLLVTEKLGNYTSGSMTDDQQNVWNYFAGGLENTGTYYLALRNNDSETSYIESPKFVGTVQSIVAHVKNGSASKVRTVYLRSSAIEKPTEGDLGETSIPTSNNGDVTLNITTSFDKFFIQVSDGLQFHKIVVTSGIAAGAHIDYITSCDAVTSSISIDNISLCVGDVHTITATIKPATAASAVSYTIKENATNAISLSGNTITALAEGTATITATIENATDYAGSSIDFKVTVDAAPVTSKVVILAQHGGQWYAMKAEYYEENKSLNAIPVTYVNGTLYNVADSEKDAIEWERTTRGNTATFKKGENYLIGTTGTDLKLGDIAFEWAVDGNLYLCDDNKRTFIFNKEGYFKNYAKTNYSNGVAIDATYSSLPVVTAPVYATGDAYGRTVTTGNFGTICIPYGSSNYKGAEFYEVAWVKMNEESMPTTLYLDQLEAGATLKAGKPYIFKATATEIAIIGDGTSVATPITGKNGLTGTFENIAAGGILVDKYIIAQNQFWTATAENYLNAYRAYIMPSSIPKTEPAEIPGRRRIAMGTAGENEATGLDNITTTDTPVKVIVNGQLIIIREGVKYNVQGVRL